MFQFIVKHTHTCHVRKLAIGSVQKAKGQKNQKTDTATCKINGNRSDGVPVVSWYQSPVEDCWKFPFILQVAVTKVSPKKVTTG